MTELQRERGEGPPRYRAFISYSHADATWGERLSRVLESYRVPATLVDTRNRSGQVLERRLGKMFRDRDELRASRSLSDSLHDALDRSDHLIVICSPSAVASPYVDAEIIHFKEQGRQDRIHALIVAGEPVRVAQSDARCRGVPAARAALRGGRRKHGHRSAF